MKKAIILSYVLIALVYSTSAQKAYQSYANGDMSINITPGKTQGDMYMGIDEIGIILNEDTRTEYLEFLTSSYAKFTEWSDVAKANNVTDMSKDIKEFNVSGYFQYGGWKFGISKHVSKFSIDADGSHMCYVYVGQFQASTNEYMESDATVYFLTQVLIDELALHLNEVTISEFITKHNSTDDLFKD